MIGKMCQIVALSAFIPFFLLALCIDEVDDENY